MAKDEPWPAGQLHTSGALKAEEQDDNFYAAEIWDELSYRTSICIIPCFDLQSCVINIYMHHCRAMGLDGFHICCNFSSEISDRIWTCMID